MPQTWGVQVATGAGEGVADVIADGAGGTYECGFTRGDLGGPAVGEDDALLTRRDGSGNVIWSTKLATADFDEGVDLALDGAGGVYMGAHVRGVLDVHFSMDFDAVVARFDGAGNLLWQRKLGVAQYERVEACAPDGVGGLLVTGVSYADFGAAAFQDGDVWLARYDASGDQLWLQQLDSGAADRPLDVSSDGAGGVLLCGSTFGALGGPLVGPFDAWYARFDGAGQMQWIRQFGTPSSSPWTGTYAYSLTLDGAGGFLLGGSTDGVLVAGSNPGQDAFLGRYDGQGNSVWLKQFGSDAFDGVAGLAADGLGGVFVLGSTQGEFAGANAGLVDVWLQRYDSAGNALAQLQLGSKNNDLPGGIALVGTAVVAAGQSIGNDEFLGTQTGTYSGWIARFEDCDFDAKSSFCVASANSTGKSATIGGSGSPYVSNNDFGLLATNLPVAQQGVFLLATGTNNVPFGNGTLCVGGSVYRLGMSSTLNGATEKQLDLTDPASAASLITAGSTWYFQFWYRDIAGGGAGFNLSNGLSVTFCP